jgi:hypothetical protein
MGKSFEIRPTGVAHAELILPEEMGPGYPRAKGNFGKGKVVEHYSWKKVTTNISGFILGSPTIDHYGDMVVSDFALPFFGYWYKYHLYRSPTIVPTISAS